MQDLSGCLINKRTEVKYFYNKDQVFQSSLMKEQKQFHGERIVFSTNDTGTIQCPHAKQKEKELRHKSYIFHKD